MRWDSDCHGRGEDGASVGRWRWVEKGNSPEVKMMLFVAGLRSAVGVGRKVEENFWNVGSRRRSLKIGRLQLTLYRSSYNVKGDFGDR